MIRKIMAGVLSVTLLSAVVFTSSAANSIDSAKKELNQIKKEINEINTKKKEVQKNLLNDKQIREQIIADLEQKGYEKSLIEEKIKEIEAAIKTLDDAIKLAQEEYDAQLALFQERIVTLYIQSRTNTNENIIFESDSFEEMFKKVHMLELISKFDQNLMASLEEKQAEINELKAAKLKEENNAQQQLELMLGEIAKLEVSRSVTEDRIQKSQQSIAQLEKAENQMEKDSLELEKLIISLASKNTKYSGGVMQWPLPGYYKVGSPFGYRIHPILRYRKFHGGIDIGAPQGTLIHAAASGKVICSAWRSGGSGNTIIIDHGGGITTLYFHIMSGGLLVKEGQTVKAGDVIAKVGSTGLSTGPHLHFEVRVNGERKDPLKYVTNKK